MRILEAQGLVKTRTGPGGGCFVHEVSENRTRALLSNYFYFKHLSITDIYQIRKKLEPELVSNLAGKLTIENIEELETIMEEYKTPLKTKKRIEFIMKHPFVFIPNLLNMQRSSSWIYHWLHSRNLIRNDHKSSSF